MKERLTLVLVTLVSLLSVGLRWDLAEPPIHYKD